VLLRENGAIVEDGVPAEVIRQPESRYRAVVNEEAELKRRWFRSAEWRRLDMQDGVLTDANTSESLVTASQPERERIA
jgi:hypothetical protein